MEKQLLKLMATAFIKASKSGKITTAFNRDLRKEIEAILEYHEEKRHFWDTEEIITRTADLITDIIEFSNNTRPD